MRKVMQTRLAIENDMVQLAGSKAYNVLALGANVADAQTIVIGNDTYEIDVIQTATGVNSSGGQLNNTAKTSVITVTAHGQSVGGLLLCQNELMRVIEVLNANTVKVKRGACGTSIATHADGQGIFKSAAGFTAGNIPVGIGAALTPIAAKAVIAGTINERLGVVKNVRAFTRADHSVVVVGTSAGACVYACTETLAGAGNEWRWATMGGYVEPGTGRMHREVRAPLAEEVTAGEIIVALDFVPKFVDVKFITTATGAVVAWDGKFVIDTTNKTVTIDNSGNTDWSANETMYLIVTE
jgi:hypothetical protein